MTPANQVPPLRFAPVGMTVRILGVTPAVCTGYNEAGMLTDAPSEAQFAPARLLAAIFSVPAPVSGSVALAGASQSVR